MKKKNLEMKKVNIVLVDNHQKILDDQERQLLEKRDKIETMCQHDFTFNVRKVLVEISKATLIKEEGKGYKLSNDVYVGDLLDSSYTDDNPAIYVIDLCLDAFDTDNTLGVKIGKNLKDDFIKKQSDKYSLLFVSGMAPYSKDVANIPFIERRVHFDTFDDDYAASAISPEYGIADTVLVDYCEDVRNYILDLLCGDTVNEQYYGAILLYGAAIARK